MKVIVTGSAGYIGGQIALQLHDAEHQVLGIDCVSVPEHLAHVFHEFKQQDFSDSEALNWIVNQQPDAVIHCAGTSLVGPSMSNPAAYFNNNVVKTLSLLDELRTYVPRCRFIFSSSAAVYGTPVMTPCDEVDPCEPISPYGHSKLMVESVLKAYHAAYNLDYVSFRYFNACGADSQRRHGQKPGATHIIAKALESLKDKTEFVLNGSTFATPDGTCVRDYVHVEDIARAHIMALDTKKIPAGVYNLGSQQGTSNLEILAACQRVTGQSVKVNWGPARSGDPDTLTANDSKFVLAAGLWRKYNLLDMVQHAWDWYNR
jgi:UDP-glucose 4-epimerase